MSGQCDALRERFGDSGKEGGIHGRGTTWRASDAGPCCGRVAVDAAAGREAVIGIAHCRLHRSTCHVAGKPLGGCCRWEHGWITVPRYSSHRTGIGHRTVSIERRISIH